MTATVSVVIPTYERREFLRGAIETALGQSFDDIEVVVVDDGSSEPYAEEIVADFPAVVRCVRHEKNEGLSAARNTGVRESNGEYIAFLDDDDRWHREKIVRQVNALAREESAGLATCLVAAITPDNELVHCERRAPSGDCSDSILIGNQIGTPSRVVVHRDIFESVEGFDESLPTKQDWDLYIRLCQEWTVAAVQDHLCFRTVHESMSSSSTALKRDKQAVLQKHESLMQKRRLWEQAKASVDAELARSYLGDGHLREARKHARRACTQRRLRYIVLYLLSYTHPQVIQRAIDLKRVVSRQFDDCGQVSMSNVPGRVG
ncbi:glycosyltransferase family 2 protein [Haloarcula sebkhae]|uniref:Glycosyltransferase family 2 protein n=1 Tax=Haloarcula sebkhae TaxID=932660 RepID=A0ACC6VJT6_9EURY|nr:glycosyltransferase family A protein [Haloarcula sebkhae]